ncbi:MAG: hypothetical protein OEY43_06405 [Gammaproteobacteria bacterium]|nr:hypothetical protein [Gammaproteobacteria bacterium]
MKKAAESIINIACLYLLMAMTAYADDTGQPPVTGGVAVVVNRDVDILARPDELLALGAPGLALRQIEKSQPAYNNENIDQWLAWERKRIQLLQHLQQWPVIIDRLDSYNALLISTQIPVYDRQWLLTQKVKALLDLGDVAKALSLTQRLLWSADEYADSDTLSLWRRLIIRAYLNSHAVEDAQRAMRRYRQDYGDMSNEDGLQWRLLQARLLLKRGSLQDVVGILKNDNTAEAEALRLFARIKHKALSVVDARKTIQKKISNKKTVITDLPVYTYVGLKLAIMAGDFAQQIILLEQLLANNVVADLRLVFPEAVNELNANTLWQAYEGYGYELANSHSLLIGDDENWYAVASNLFKKKALDARALLAVLAFSAKDERHQQLAMEQLARLIDEQENGLVVINQLFLASKYFVDNEKIPAVVRYRLVDFALSQADLVTAANLMEKLHQPPAGQGVFEWTLRRARVLILGGQYEEGSKILNQLLMSGREFSEKQIDQVMQVIFDFQNVEQHALALASFKLLEKLPLSDKVRRELGYWQAESYQAGDDFEQAAMLFLQSARPVNGEFDPWYHTASFKAAESLAQAGLISDARQQYTSLLKRTENPARKSMIRQRLQQLRLQQGRQFSVGNGE